MLVFTRLCAERMRRPLFYHILPTNAITPGLCPDHHCLSLTAVDKNLTTSHPRSTSRTPTPVLRQPRHAYHVFSDFLCPCRCLEQLLGDLACFLGKQQEE